MTKWQKDAKEFPVGVSVTKDNCIKMNLPKPIYELLHKPKKIRFIIKGNKVVVENDK